MLFSYLTALLLTIAHVSAAIVKDCGPISWVKHNNVEKKVEGKGVKCTKVGWWDSWAPGCRCNPTNWLDGASSYGSGYQPGTNADCPVRWCTVIDVCASWQGSVCIGSSARKLMVGRSV